MGSEGPSSTTTTTTVHVTGFRKFHGVVENPTETVVSNLKEYLQRKGLPKGLVLGSCNVLETAGEGVVGPLYKILETAINGQDKVNLEIWLHLGVNSASGRFAFETQAVNEATFPCPDEFGWKPQNVPIISSDGGSSQVRKSSLPIFEITKSLAIMGYPVMLSDDAGRFVCNYVYYHSLRFAEEHGIKSLFVHVPLFVTINEEVQMEFVASLLEVLASLHY